MIKRDDELRTIRKLLDIFPVVAILGARQCGKTTLAKAGEYDHYFDLENPQDLARLDQAQVTLEKLKGLIVVDEIQRRPELFPLLRYLVDTNREQQYLILGSASPELIKQSSESLAGRIGFHYLSGFNLLEIAETQQSILWLRGGYPLSFLANDDDASQIWRENYIATFLERDLPQLGIQISSTMMRRFWIMLSHYHSHVINYAEIGRSFGISDMTIRKYVDILEGTFMIRALWPWHINTRKRLVKRPKIYIRDSGIFHTLQSITSNMTLETHPKLGASWEGFALENTSRVLNLRPEQLFFWGTHEGAEIDLFWQSGGKNYAAEFKFTDAPRRTKSMQVALQDLSLQHLWIIYPGSQRYEIDEGITALPLSQIAELTTSPQ